MPRRGRPATAPRSRATRWPPTNVDAKTLKLTWIDFPIDNGLTLYIDRVNGHLRLLLIQPEPSGTTDAIGFDRELVLTFSQPVSASSVETFLQGGLDTPG